MRNLSNRPDFKLRKIPVNSKQTEQELEDKKDVLFLIFFISFFIITVVFMFLMFGGFYFLVA